MFNKVLFFSLFMFSAVLVGMNRAQLPVAPREQLQQSVHSRLGECERGQKQLDADLKFLDGEMNGRVGSLAKRNDQQFRDLQALIQTKAKETQAETVAIRARLGAVEGALANETAARQAADAQLTTDLRAEAAARRATDTALTDRIDNTQIVLGIAVVSGAVAAICFGFTWDYNGQVNANVNKLYHAVNEGRPNNKQVTPKY